MTGCDLSSSSKPWGVQEKTTKVVYQEFHEQVFMQIFLQHCQISRVVNFPGSFFNFPEIAYTNFRKLGTYYSKYIIKKANFLILYTRSRLSAQALIMTGSDLSSSSKSWDVQDQTTKVVYEEFHEQVLIFILTDTRTFR